MKLRRNKIVNVDTRFKELEKEYEELQQQQQQQQQA